MKFQSFWEIISKTKSKKFMTLKQKKPFDVTFENNILIIKPGKTKQERPITRNELLKVWRKAVKLSPGQRYVPNNYQNDTFHSSYIVAIMKSIVNDDKITV